MKDSKYYLKLEDKGYYETIDKRSKDYREYKQWKSENTFATFEVLKNNIDSKSKGLGDTIAKVTKATGIDKIVKFVAGEDCGCDERQEKWNAKFNYKGVKCVSEDDYNFLKDFFSAGHNSVNFEQRSRLYDIYNYAFGTALSKNTSCSSCVASVVRKLKSYLEDYK
tara:strand:- start:1890 stop:2387 length:498 start_codon:yes stop_codon:yes gene_type:complete